MKAIIAASALGAVFLSGCANTSMILGTTEVVSLETSYGSKLLPGASCRLENSQGVWYLTSPDTITIHRSYDDLNVKCSKEGYPTTVATFGAKEAYAGFAPSAADISQGSPYRYPSLLVVRMDGAAPYPNDGRSGN